MSSIEPTREMQDLFRYADETGIPREEMTKIIFDRDYYKTIIKERKTCRTCCWTALALSIAALAIFIATPREWHTIAWCILFITWALDARACHATGYQRGVLDKIEDEEKLNQELERIIKKAEGEECQPAQ